MAEARECATGPEPQAAAEAERPGGGGTLAPRLQEPSQQASASALRPPEQREDEVLSILVALCVLCWAGSRRKQIGEKEAAVGEGSGQKEEQVQRPWSRGGVRAGG